MAFQNPAQNFAEQRLSLGNLVSLAPRSIFLVRSDSHYPRVGIMRGSVFAIDRALAPQHRHIIVAVVLKKLLINPVPALQELQGNETLTLLNESLGLSVWNVVAYALTAITGSGFSASLSE